LDEAQHLGDELVLLRGWVVLASDDDLLSGVVVYNILELVIRVAVPSSNTVEEFDLVGANFGHNLSWNLVKCWVHVS